MAFDFHGENEYSRMRAREHVNARSGKPPATRRRIPNAAARSDYDGLSKRLKQVARYVLDEPNELALETLAVIAERCGVQPSAIVRFAQAFGFSGASQMQRLFRDGLLSANAAIGYGERVRRFSESVSQTAAGDGLLSEFVEGNILALQNLSETVSEQEMRGGGRPHRQGRGRPCRGLPPRLSDLGLSRLFAAAARQACPVHRRRRRPCPAAGQYDRPTRTC